jgi:hypothetical protein
MRCSISEGGILHARVSAEIMSLLDASNSRGEIARRRAISRRTWAGPTLMPDRRDDVVTILLPLVK